MLVAAVPICCHAAAAASATACLQPFLTFIT
jgi:hypothetical protein